LKFKQSLGQNILHNKHTLKFIIDHLNLSGNEAVLEIGGGTGKLTEYIVKNNNYTRLKIVEIDQRFIEILNEIVEDYENTEIINEDILQYPVDFSHKIVVAGNIPYYITKPIIKHLSKYKDNIIKAVLMVQNEVAKSFTAKPGDKKYTAFTVFLKNIGKIKYLKKVNKGDFIPQPKVDSALIEIKFNDIEKLFRSEEFDDFIFNSFRHRRKTLYNNLKNYYDRDKIKKSLKDLDIKTNIRAEKLTLKDFKNLYKKLL